MIIRFSKNFYNLEAIKNTIKAYEGLATFCVGTKKDSIELEAINVDEDIKSVFEDEFCNYVLSEMKKNKSQCL